VCTSGQIGPLPIVSQFPQFPYLQLKERRFIENESRSILLAAAKQLIGEHPVRWPPSAPCAGLSDFSAIYSRR
jgi:hypothetical protein